MSRAGIHRAGRRPEKSRALARQSRTHRSLRHRLDVVGQPLALALARAHKAEEDNASLHAMPECSPPRPKWTTSLLGS